MEETEYEKLWKLSHPGSSSGANLESVDEPLLRQPINHMLVRDLLTNRSQADGAAEDLS
jgi:hypothetical protein